MRVEIRSAANFLSNLLRLANAMEDVRLNEFRVKLEDLLKHHYQQHWFPEKPCKGSGYRCIRINHKMDPILAKAGFACGWDEQALRHMFPNELTLWVDPKEVSYRIGENGSICVLFDGTIAKASTSTTTSSSSQSMSSQSGKNHGLFPATDNERRQQSMAKTAKYHHRNNGVLYPQHGSNSTYDTKKSSTCKDSLRNSWDCFIMDPRNVHLEQLAAYVSS